MDVDRRSRSRHGRDLEVALSMLCLPGPPLAIQPSSLWPLQLLLFHRGFPFRYPRQEGFSLSLFCCRFATRYEPFTHWGDPTFGVLYQLKFYEYYCVPRPRGRAVRTSGTGAGNVYHTLNGKGSCIKTVSSRLFSQPQMEPKSRTPYSREDHRTAKYKPSIATLACHIPNRRVTRSIAGAGNTSTNETGTRTIRDMPSSSVIPGLITRK